VPSLPLDDENRPLFTVGQVSEMLNVQQAFLRRLDEFAVVTPTRSAGGQRRYTRNEIVAVRYVVELIDDGLTLAAVRRVLQLEARVRELEAERDALRALAARLHSQLAEWQGQVGGEPAERRNPVGGEPAERRNPVGGEPAERRNPFGG
jgi:MerR family transcriptional regulator, heat shock protein HspR